ncbi:MAG: phospholipase [Alphaproteobacteria bacterium]|nr:phospholipase [Alphaproteobacteria bacterium]
MSGLAEVAARHKLQSGGATVEQTRAVVLLIHGRGASAASILQLGEAIGVEGLCYLAPQAHGFTWYPHSFMAPQAANEPFLSAALARVEAIIADLLDAGLAAERLAVAGFSQGACVTAETVLRHPRPYGFVGILSGGAIGPPGTPRNYRGTLATVPVFLGCSDHDPHIPLARVKETTALYRAMGAEVTERIYPGSMHGVNEDEILHLRQGLSRLTG